MTSTRVVDEPLFLDLLIISINFSVSCSMRRLTMWVPVVYHIKANTLKGFAPVHLVDDALPTLMRNLLIPIPPRFAIPVDVFFGAKTAEISGIKIELCECRSFQRNVLIRKKRVIVPIAIRFAFEFRVSVDFAIGHVWVLSFDVGFAKVYCGIDMKRKADGWNAASHLLRFLVKGQGVVTCFDVDAREVVKSRFENLLCSMSVFAV